MTIPWPGCSNRGILVAVNDGLAELPREIVIGARPGGLAPSATLRPLAARPVAGLAAGSVAATSADQANRVLEAAEAIIRLAEDGELAVRRTGGVGVREIRRVAKLLEVEPRQVGRLLELLLDARLIQVRTDQGRSQPVGPTTLTGHWWRLPRGRRWLVLVRAWVASSGFLSSALSLDLDGKPVPALIDHDTVAAAYAARQVVLDTVASIPSGQAYDPDQLTEAVVWRSPNLWGTGDPDPEELVAWTLAEAELLGLVAHNGPAPMLVALAGGDESTVETEAATALGADQDQIVLQSDLTAVALGPLDPTVAGRLAELADRQADSSVPVFRFSEGSIRRGLDRGWTVESITTFLGQHALSGLPQPLSYLLADVERRYGAVRVLASTGVIVTVDEATAVEIASTTRAARLGLRLVAPTVLVGPVDAAQLVEELRTEGFFPVLDGEPATYGLDAPTTDSPSDDGLPADWTGPVLPDAALPGEVADAVDALQSDAVPSNGAVPTDRLHLLWNRWAVVTHTRDGELTETRGVVVGLDESLTLLAEDGVEELPLEAVVTVEDPTR